MPYLNVNTPPPQSSSSSATPKGKPQGMFSHPFSFNGRIRRTEFWLSGIVGSLAYAFVMTIIGVAANGPSDHISALLFIIIGLPSIITFCWFMYAQGCKRAHDVGHSGWLQLVPFYPLYLLFAEGDRGANQYGADPKGY